MTEHTDESPFPPRLRPPLGAIGPGDYGEPGGNRADTGSRGLLLAACRDIVKASQKVTWTWQKQS